MTIEGRLEEVKNKLDVLNKKLYRLIHLMTTSHVSFDKRFKYSELQLKNVQQNNKKGYNALMEYNILSTEEVELLAEKERLLSQVTK